jgi:hypothetical protein
MNWVKSVVPRGVVVDGQALVGVEVADQPGEGGGVRQVDADDADRRDVIGQQRRRVHERAAGAGRIERVGVLVVPILRRDVPGDPGNPRRGHGGGHLGLAGGALVVDGGDDARLVDRADAGHGLIEVGAVVAGVDLDAGAVGAATGVERLGRRFEADRLVLERDDRRLEHRHQADDERRLGRVARAVVPQAERLVVDRLGTVRAGRGGGGVARLSAVVITAARGGEHGQRHEHRDESRNVPRHPLIPLRAAGTARRRTVHQERTSFYTGLADGDLSR